MQRYTKSQQPHCPFFILFISLSSTSPHSYSLLSQLIRENEKREKEGAKAAAPGTSAAGDDKATQQALKAAKKREAAAERKEKAAAEAAAAAAAETARLEAKAAKHAAKKAARLARKQAEAENGGKEDDDDDEEEDVDALRKGVAGATITSKQKKGRSNSAGGGSGKSASNTGSKEGAMKSGGRRISKAPQMAKEANASDSDNDYVDDDDNGDLAKAITESVGLHSGGGPNQNPPLRLGQSIAALPTPPAAPAPKKTGFEAVTTAEGAGDLLWACDTCTFHNRSLALSCEVCSSARPAEVTAVPPTFNGGYDNPHGVLCGGTPQQRHLWTCLACTFSNDPDQGRCEVCNVPRNQGAPSAKPPLPGANTAGAASGDNTTGRNSKKAGKKNKADKKGPAPAPTTTAAAGAAAGAGAAIDTGAIVETCAVTGDQFTAADLEKRRIADDGGLYTKQVGDTSVPSFLPQLLLQ